VSTSAVLLAAALVLTGSDEPGVPFVIRGVVRGPDGTAVPGASLHVFHTDSRGWYTPTKVMDEPHARLAGSVSTDAEGRFEIRTIRPGSYPATAETHEDRRIPQHVHFEISAAGFAFRRFQLVFTDDPRMTPYWHEWARRGRNPLVPVERHEDGSQSCEVEIVLVR